MRVWRLARRVHASLDGAGARRAGGRWNSPGRPVVYTSRHLSLAALELLVHVDSDTLPSDLTAFAIDVPDALPRQQIDPDVLAANWREQPAVTRAIGDAWLTEAAVPVLVVPSVLGPNEENVLLNPLHAACRAARVVTAGPFRFDARLLGALR